MNAREKASGLSYERAMEGQNDRNVDFWDRWVDYRSGIADELYAISERIFPNWPKPADNDSFGIWQLSEDARSLPHEAAKVCDFVQALEEYAHVEGVKAVIDQLTELLEEHFNVSTKFWTRKPTAHELRHQDIN